MSEKIYTIYDLAKTNPSEAFKQAIAMLEVFQEENTALKEQLAEAVKLHESYCNEFCILPNCEKCTVGKFLQSLKEKEVKE